MIKHHDVKVIVLFLCSFKAPYSVTNKIPLFSVNDSLVEKIQPFYHCSYNYKGIYAINDYGWCITQKPSVSLQQLELNGRWVDVKDYFPHPQLGFALFKVDLGNDHQRNQLPKLEQLADKEDLQSNANWVTSLAFVSDSFFHKDEIGENKEGCVKPLHVISKIEKQENGLLKLSSRGPIENLFQEIWFILKQKLIYRCLANANHINKFLENPNYRIDYLRQNGPKLIQKNINHLIKQKNDLIEYYQKFYASISCDVPLFSQVEQELNGLDAFREVNRRISILQSFPVPLEIEFFTVENQIILFKNYFNKMARKQADYIQYLNELKVASASYTQISLALQEALKYHIIHHLGSTYLGVADRKDHGGLILVESKDLILNNNKYGYYTKIAGITCENDESVEGETNTAIDLTTPKVHEWISKKIDAYYNSQDPTDKGKRPADESGPSDPNKRPGIKEEPTNDDTAPNPNTVQVKEEIKEEVKQES